jgi:hypothetical protein
MLANTRATGATLVCDACQTEISGHGQVFFKFDGKATTTVLVVHAACEQSRIVTMLMPEHRSVPLGLYLEQLLERVSV